MEEIRMRLPTESWCRGSECIVAAHQEGIFTQAQSSSSSSFPFLPRFLCLPKIFPRKQYSLITSPILVRRSYTQDYVPNLSFLFFLHGLIPQDYKAGVSLCKTGARAKDGGWKGEEGNCYWCFGTRPGKPKKLKFALCCSTAGWMELHWEGT